MPTCHRDIRLPAAAACLLALAVQCAAGDRDLDYSQYMHWSGGVFLDSWVQDLDSEGDLIVASEPNAITFYEIDADDVPRRVATLSLPYHCRHLDLHGDCLATAQLTGNSHGNDVVKVYDVGDPAAPRLRFKMEIGERVEDVLTDGRFVYVLVADEGVRIYDIREFPATPLIATIETGYNSNDEMHLRGQLLFVEGLNTLFDLSNPSEPVALWQPADDSVRAAFIDDGFVQVVRNVGLRFFDISDPGAPVWLADLDPHYGVEDMIARGETLFLVHDTNQGGMATVDLSDSQAPEFRGEVKFEPAKRVTLTSDRVVVLTWPHHARCRLEVVDVTSIESAPLAGRIEGNLSEFAAYGQLGVVGYYGDAAYLLDLQDPDNPVEVASIHDQGNLYSLRLGDGWLAATDSSPAVRFYDVSTPSLPILMSSVPMPGRVNGLRQCGDFLAGMSTDIGIVLIDISDIHDPVLRSVTPFSGYLYSLEFTEGGIYVDSSDQIWRVDVSDPDAPVRTWSLPVDGHVGRIIIDDGIMYTAVRGPYDRFHVDRFELDDPTSYPSLIDQIELPQAYSLEKHGNFLYANGTSLQVVALGETMSVVGQGPVSAQFMGRPTVVGDRIYTPCSFSGIFIHHRQAEILRPLAAPSVLNVHLAAAPNPFNPRTSISYTTPVAAHVRLQVIDVRGRLIATLVDGHRAAGHHEVTWTGRNDAGLEMPSGVYFSRLTAGWRVAHGRMTLVR